MVRDDHISASFPGSGDMKSRGVAVSVAGIQPLSTATHVKIHRLDSIDLPQSTGTMDDAPYLVLLNESGGQQRSSIRAHQPSAIKIQPKPERSPIDDK